MSKRSFLRKSAISLTATLGLGGTVAYAADITLTGNTLNVGTRTIDAPNALRGAYYDPGANPPEASFNSVSGIRALEAQYIADGVTGVMEANLTVDLNFDQATTVNPFEVVSGGTVDFATNDTIAAVWSGELVVAPTAAGVYNFATASDDGSVIHIDGDYVLNNNVYQGRTRRDRTGYVLTPGVHTIVMGWYEGGSGANMTAYMSGGPTNAPEEILNPSSPLSGLTFRKVTYTADNTVNGMNVIVNANSGLNIQQDTPPAFGSLTMANNTTLTVDSITTASFTGTNVGATSTFNVTGGRVQTGALNTGGAVATINKTGSGNLDLNRVAANVPTGSVFNVQAGTLTVLTAGSLGNGTVNLSGGTLAINAAASNGVGWSGLETKEAFDAALAGLTPIATRSLDTPNDLEINFPRGDANPDNGGTNDLPDPIFNVDGADLNVPLTGNEPFIARFNGKLNVTAAGATRFGLGSNDGSAMFLDTDLGAGTNWVKVADNNRFTGTGGGDFQGFNATGDGSNNSIITPQPGPITLATGAYDFTVGFFNTQANEAGVELYWVPSGAAAHTLIPGASMTTLNGDFYRATATSLALDQNVTVTANSGINVVSPSATASNVTINPGVTLSQSGNPLTITNLRSTGAGAINLAPSGVVNVVNLIDDGKAVTFNAAGSGDVILTKVGGPGLGAGSSVGATAGGTLVATNDNKLVSTLGNTPVTLSGGTLELRVSPVEGTTRVPGLQGGRVAGNFNLTAFPAVSAGIDFRLSRAQSTDNNFFGGNNGTWVYTGEVRIPDTDGDKTPGPIAFGEQFDDGVLLRIDGVEFMNNNAWQEPTSSGEIELVDNEPDGKGTAGDGWFSFEARFGQGTGGVGPNTGWTIGFGIDRNGADGFDGQGPGALPEQYVEPVEPGDMSLFRTFGFQPVNFQGNVTATQTSTIDVTGPNTVGASQLGNVAANAGATLTIQGNRLKVNDVTTAAGGVIAFTSAAGGEVAGSINGAGTVRLDRGVVDFSKSGAAASGTPTLSISPLTTARFTPGSGNTFGAAAVSAITQNGTLHAANGVVDLSGATVTTTLQPGSVTAAGLADVTGDFYDGATVPTAQNSANTFGWAGLDTKAAFDAALAGKATLATRAINLPINFPRGDGNLVDGGTNDLGVEQIFNVDGANLGVALAGNDDFVVRFRGKVGVSSAGPTGFGLAANDGGVMFLDLDQGAGENWVKVADHNRFSTTGGGAFDEHGTAGVGNPGAPAIPQPAQPNLAVGAYDFIAGFYNANANEAGIELYWDPAGPGGRSIIPTGTVVGTSVVQIDSGVTLKVGALVDIPSVNLAATGRLELHNGTSKLAAGALPIPGGPGAATATVDLTDARLAVQSSAATKTADFNSLYADLKQGFNQGDWKGLGITSSTAADNKNTDTGVAVVDNALLGLTDFGGRTVDANSILLKYTYYGDIDQNGQVDADDLTVFAGNFGRTSGATQVDGDIDFNGTVDADDLTIFANNFNKGIGAPLADGAASVQAVPEPASLVLAGLGAAGLLAGVAARRRNKRVE